MLARVDLRGFPATCAPRSARPLADGERRSRASVAAIIADGPAAGRRRRARAHRRFDGGRVDELRVPPKASCSARSTRSIPTRARRARVRPRSDRRLARSAARHRSSSRAARRRRARARRCPSIAPAATCRAAGRAYPSSVLMTALPARVAGVPEVVLCVPPGPDGAVARSILAGGRARAASTRCTASAARRRSRRWRSAPSRSAPVDVDRRPGQRVRRRGQAPGRRRAWASTRFAGPSELAVVADDTADPALRRGRPARAGRARSGRDGDARHVGAKRSPTPSTWRSTCSSLTCRPPGRGRVDARRRAGASCSSTMPRARDRRHQRDRARAPRADVRRRRGARAARAQRGRGVRRARTRPR